MPRVKSHSRTALVDSALTQFWKVGYHVISMNDLVRGTGVSRGGIYSDFNGKEDLFHACLERYQETVVTPVFGQVEADHAGLEAIRHYLETLIEMFENSDGPGPGCLVANTLAQIDHDETETRLRLEQHGKRLTAGFHAVLTRENQSTGRLSEADIDALADFTLISIQGMWSRSREVSDAGSLRQYTDTLMMFLEARVRGTSL